MGIVVLQSGHIANPLSSILAINGTVSNIVPQILSLNGTISTSILQILALLNDAGYTYGCIAFSNSFGSLNNFAFKVVLGDQDYLYVSVSMRDEQIFILHNQCGTYELKGQILLNEVQGVYENKTSSNIQSILCKLLNTDTLRSIESVKNSIALEESTFSINNIISEGKQDAFSILNELSSSVAASQGIVLDISSLSDLFQINKIVSSIYEVEGMFSSVDYAIYLDGVDVSDLVVRDIIIQKSQDNIHNSISFNSTSEELYNKADPSTLYGEVRIEVHIGSTVMYFLLEERSHVSTGEVSYWGRDATARDSAPYSPSVYIQLTEPTSAKEVCETFFVGMSSVVDWDILDWVLPATFESTGTPVEVISEIASEIGAIVCAQDDASLLVRYHHSIRPVNLSTASPVYSYYGDAVYDVTYSMEFGGGYTAVTVTADTDDKVAPLLEVEDAIGDSRIIGEDTYIRAYYYESPPESANPVVLTQDVTDGTIKHLSIETEEVTEIIVFEDAVGSSSYPLKTLKNVTWLGRTNNILTWDEYSTDITLETDDNCLAEITYDSEYYRYKASGHNISELLAVFEIESSFISSVKVLMPDDSKEGEELVTSYLTSLNALSKRGEVWLDQNKYDEETITFESPYVENVHDGSIIWLEADRLTSGKYQVYDASISINGPKVVNTFTVKRCQV